MLPFGKKRNIIVLVTGWQIDTNRTTPFEQISWYVCSGTNGTKSLSHIYNYCQFGDDMSYANSILYHTLADPVRPRYCCSERHHWQETNNFASSRSLGKCGYFFTRWVPRKRKKNNQRANVNIHRAWLVWYVFCVLFPKLASKTANTHTHKKRKKCGRVAKLV